MELFRKLSRQRGTDQGLPKRLAFTEIEACLRLMGEAITSIELDYVLRMDAAWSRAMGAEIAADIEQGKRSRGD